MTAPDADLIADFGASLGRCHANPRFIPRFYEQFVAASPEVAEKFKDTDLERQGRAMSSSLYALVMVLEGGEAAILYLDKIGRQHGREGLDIRPRRSPSSTRTSRTTSNACGGKRWPSA
jgi:hypothetical protein